MGWSGSLTAGSALGASITFTPGTTAQGAYTVSSFTAPKKGVYRFTLKGSGGTGVKTSGENGNEAGGEGGYTVGYLLLKKGQTVYVGAGGTCSAAFVSSATGAKLSAISQSSLYFVAGAGGEGGKYEDNENDSGYNCKVYAGGVGGGAAGGPGGHSVWAVATSGGTQTAGGTSTENGGAGSYGTGGTPSSQWEGTAYWASGGRGGDGYYGGAGGYGDAHDNGVDADGGGGGSGYVKTATLTVLSKTYTSTTSQGGGAAANTTGSVMVTYYARAELPIIFNGTQLERLIFNGTEIESLIFNGTKLFFENLRRRLNGWFMSMKTAMPLKASI